MVDRLPVVAMPCVHPVRNAISLSRLAVGLVAVVLGAGCSAVVDPLAIADAQTAARVRTALINDPALGARTIDVRVVRGVVQLSGRVLAQAEVDRAVALSRAVSGVAEVRSDLQVSGEPIVPLAEEAARGVIPRDDSPELQDNPRLLAVGGSVGLSSPHAAALKTRVTISPLIKIGDGRGLGPAMGLHWFQAEIQSTTEPPTVLTRVHVKPLMLGAGYTLGSERLSVSISVVGGYAWNSLTVTATGSAEGLPVEVDNSLVWRPGVSVWYDASRRTAVNVSVGHVRTRLRLTVLDDGRLEKRPARGDTTIVHAGIAYRLF
jgi:hypothetical protein